MSADASVVQDEGPDVNESIYPVPSDMNISKVGQASAAEVQNAALAAAAAAESALAAVASTSVASVLTCQCGSLGIFM